MRPHPLSPMLFRLLGFPLAIAVLCQAPADGFMRLRRSDNLVPLHRSDFLNIPSLINTSTAAGLANSKGGITITANSDPLAALGAAMRTWNGVNLATIHFATPGSTAVASAGSTNGLVTFADTPANESLVGDAVAVSMQIAGSAPTGDPGASLSDGTITETFTVFNPLLAFSTTLQKGTYDIQSVFTHELGHWLGADESGVIGSVMFAGISAGSSVDTVLTSDDVAFATSVYPAATFAAAYGSITGTITLNGGGPVPGALVAAADPSNNSVVGSVTAADGTFSIPVPAGQYVFTVDPQGVMVDPALNDYGAGANINFSPAVLGGASSPQMLSVSAGSATTANLAVNGPAPTLEVQYSGGALQGGGITLNLAAALARIGYHNDVILVGKGLDDPTITEATVSFVGNGIKLLPNTLGPQPEANVTLPDGTVLPALGFTVDVAPTTPAGVVTVLIRAGSGASTVFSGGLRVLPLTPSITVAGVVNGASFSGGPIAPGEIVSIFGGAMGPNAPAHASLDPATGLVSTTAGGVVVTFNSVMAPIFYAQAGQINVQVPYELAGQNSAAVTLTYQNFPSPTITVPVGEINPGVFFYPFGSQAVVFNQDGKANDANHPAPRGSIITVYATGQGPIQPPLATGQLAPVDPLSRATQTTTVTIGGTAADVRFAGMTPGLAGLFQINAAVSPQTAPGTSVSLIIAVGGVESAVTTVAIQ